ncbi:MAG: hypothetical protein RLZZ512_1055 [Bacteroidota bacterium]|jgi:hypothetical protein
MPMGEQHSDQRSKVALLAKIVSIITFPGFVAAAGFWLLREGVYVSEDLLGENVVVAHLHFSGALFGYVLVPLFFVFFLLWLKKIDSIKMPLLADRKWGFLGAIVGALQVFVMTWVDAPERAGRQLKLLSKQLDASTMSTLRDLYSSRVDQRIVLLEEEIQAYTLVVLVGLLLMYVFVLLNRKLSIHMCAAATTVTQSFIGMFHLYDRIPEEEQFVKSFGMPWGGWGNDWEFPLVLAFVLFGVGLLALIYWARRKEKAHSHGELLGGLLLGFGVPLLGLLF